MEMEDERPYLCEIKNMDMLLQSHLLTFRTSVSLISAAKYNSNLFDKTEGPYAILMSITWTSCNIKVKL